MKVTVEDPDGDVWAYEGEDCLVAYPLEGGHSAVIFKVDTPRASAELMLALITAFAKYMVSIDPEEGLLMTNALLVRSLLTLEEDIETVEVLK